MSPRVSLGDKLKFQIMEITSFCPEHKFQHHQSTFGDHNSPESLVRLRHMSSHRNAEKVNRDVGIESFRQLHLNWSQTFIFLWMLNSDQIRFSAAWPTSERNSS
jgi:hypothetical protein